MDIQRNDVVDVATSLNKQLTEDEISYIVRNYPGWQASLPMDNWDVVIEDMIYFLEKYPDAVFEEDASTDDCRFDREEDVPPINRFRSDGDGDTNMNFMG